MNQKTRVENEVAIISLAASALSGFKPHVVPCVYGWGSAATPSSQGWILQELMPGTPVDEAFESMHLDPEKNYTGRRWRSFSKHYKILHSLRVSQGTVVSLLTTLDAL